MHRLKWLIPLLGLVLLGPSQAAPVHPPREGILAYHSNIDVQADGTLIVQEIIEVNAMGQSIHHGIYRDFPTHYRDRLGNLYVVGFDLLGATLDEAPVSSRVESRANGVRIYLGNPNSMLPPGVHTFSISYTTNRQMGFFPDHDELFWNVTGNGWAFPIEHASAKVRLPAQIPGGTVQLSGYTGPQGAMAQDLTWQASPDGSYEFASRHSFQPYEGMTILLKWPKGYFAEPTLQDKIGYILKDNQSALILTCGLLLVLCYYVIAWFLVGRDPAPGPIVVQYEPPPDFSPAAVRELVRMGFDNKAFTAAVLNMAVKGYLKIKEDFGTYTLSATGSAGENLAPEEQLAGAALFTNSNEILLHNTNHADISNAINMLKGALKKKEVNVLFNTHFWATVPAVLLSIGLLIAASYADGPQNVPAVSFICVWLTIWTIAVSAMVITEASLCKRVFTEKHHKIAVAGQATLTGLFLIPFLGGEVMGLFLLAKTASILVAVLLIGTVFIHVLFHFLMKAPTQTGRSVLDRIEGFKRFLSAVEGDRLNRVNPPDLTPAVFEKFLPYALALDVEQAWAERFSGVLSAAGNAPGGSGSAYSPGWYSGSAFTAGDGIGGFTSSLGGSFSSAISSSATAPGSSGGGGGGSGGGGGGGGGGGW